MMMQTMEPMEKIAPPPLQPLARRAGAVVVSVLLVVGGLLVAGVLPRLRRQAEVQAAGRAAEAAVVVNITKPLRSGEGGELSLPGSIQAVQQTAINARTSGYLRKWYVDIGARVRAGQLLAEIDSPEVDQQLAQARSEAAQEQAKVSQARAAVGTAQAGLEQARADVARLRGALEQARADAARAQAGLMQARSETARAQAVVAQARAQLARAEAALGQAREEQAVRQAGLRQAQANLQIADKSWQRWQMLAQGGFVSLQEADERRSTFDARRADVEAAEAAVGSAGSNITAAQSSVEASRADLEAAGASLRSTEANVRAAGAGVRSSLSNVQAARGSVRSGEANVQAARTRLEASRDDVAAAEAAAKASQANVQRNVALQSFQRVTAPFAGIITARNVENGALINAGGSAAGSGTSSGDNSTATNNGAMRGGLFGLARSDVLRIQVNVPQAYVASIRPGQKAEVLVREFPRQRFTGQVYHIAGALDSTARTLLAEVRLRNPQYRLVPGMYAQVQLVPAGPAQRLRVPANTLVFGPEGPRVVTVTPEQKVRYQKVQLGRDFGTEVELLDGLRGDESLIVNPEDSLKEGERVRVAAAGGD
jgi:multidrug efflux pump subunit AcrA (membrane-fusion protein)